jgi:hypothetical protein
MHLHPAITEDEAYNWLRKQVLEDGAREDAPLEESLRSMAEAMAAISQVVLPDDVEPLFP